MGVRKERERDFAGSKIFMGVKVYYGKKDCPVVFWLEFYGAEVGKRHGSLRATYGGVWTGLLDPQG